MSRVIQLIVVHRCFGDKGDVEDITEADIISTVEFDHTGNYLATGDKGGRVVLFERNETVLPPLSASFFADSNLCDRKKPASISSTPNFSRTNRSSTILNP
jgi:hypothetical protein